MTTLTATLVKYIHIHCADCGILLEIIAVPPDYVGPVPAQWCEACMAKRVAELQAELDALKQEDEDGDPCYNRWDKKPAGFTWADDETYIERDRRRVINWPVY